MVEIVNHRLKTTARLRVPASGQITHSWDSRWRSRQIRCKINAQSPSWKMSSARRSGDLISSSEMMVSALGASTPRFQGCKSCVSVGTLRAIGKRKRVSCWLICNGPPRKWHELAVKWPGCRFGLTNSLMIFVAQGYRHVRWLAVRKPSLQFPHRCRLQSVDLGTEEIDTREVIGLPRHEYRHTGLYKKSMHKTCIRQPRPARPIACDDDEAGPRRRRHVRPPVLLLLHCTEDLSPAKALQWSSWLMRIPN
ncbi:hypothetical protein K456DRAFT_756240 [Colletotrichum gloeosporioides 23]|nr:hypothetical protein K456DRAFT_756240 [Colletotrichum gloeosporioides 23]